LLPYEPLIRIPENIPYFPADKTPFFSVFWVAKMQGVLYAEYIHVDTFYKIGVPKSKGVLSVGVLSTGKYGTLNEKLV
jgi:hypothetical protein